MRRGVWLALALFLGLSGAGFAGVAGVRAQTAPGPTITSYDASAGADGVRVGVFITGFPLVNQVVDVGAPSAQAAVNALGKSQAFAAMPYPGDAVLTLPSTVLPLLGVPSPPGFPLIASSDASTSPEATVSQPGLSMTAKSEERSSTAKVVAGGGSGVGSAEATATSKVDAPSGEVSATSAMNADVVSVQGVLRIGHVGATAQVTQGTSGDAKVASTFSAEGVTIAGVSVGVSDKGIVLPGTSTRVPDTSGLSPVLDLAGVSMKVLPVERHANSVVSSGLVVSTKAAGPTGDILVTHTFGRASAAASGSFEAAPAGSSAGGDIAAPASPPDSSDVAAAPAASGAVGTTAGLTSTSPTLSSGVASSPRRPAAAPSSRPGQTAVALAGASSSTTSAASLYLVLVVGAVVAASGLVLVRLFGVKLLWT
jgi:hypothetical protein